MKPRILIVEDDPTLAKTLSDSLFYEGYGVRCVGDAALVTATIAQQPPDLLIVDVVSSGADTVGLQEVMPPGGGTFAVALIRKPFDLEELLAQVRALLGRMPALMDRIRIGNVSIDFVLRTAHRGHRTLHLTDREFQLLRFFAGRQGQVVYREELLKELWGYRDHPVTRSVDHAIARLRRKIEADVHHPRFIHTVRGDGYSLTPQGLPAQRAR